MRAGRDDNDKVVGSVGIVVSDEDLIKRFLYCYLTELPNLNKKSSIANEMIEAKREKLECI